MEFLADLAHLPSMLEYIRKEAEKNNVAPAALYKVELASEEALVNIINYAYPEEKKGIWIDLKNGGDYFEIHIKDRGIPFNPLEQKLDIGRDLPIEERKIGGLGIYLMGQLMDKVTYNRIKEENYLVLYIRRKN